jgi:hypothetical protein
VPIKERVHAGALAGWVIKVSARAAFASWVSFGLFTNSGTVVTNNLSYHQRHPCPDPSVHEQNATCADPLLMDDTYHPYGDWDLSLSASSPAKGKGVAVSGVTADYMGNPRNNPPAIGAFEGTDW